MDYSYIMNYGYENIYKLVDSKTIFSWIVYLLKSSAILPRMGFKLCIRVIAALYGVMSELYHNLHQAAYNSSINDILLQIYNHSPDFAMIFTGLVTLSLGTFVYIKLQYPFWSCQPVFKTYEFWRYCYSKPFIIRDYPMATKYCDFNRMKTIDYLETSQESKTQIVDLLRCHYIATDRLLYTINESILDAYGKGNLDTAYSTTYCVNGKLRGFMCSRPIRLYFLGNSQIIAYYWDTICTATVSATDCSGNHTTSTALDYTSHDRDVSRRLIQTHEYNQRMHNPRVKVSLFKKEISLCNELVPLTKYKTTSYYLKPPKLKRMPHHMHVQHIVKTNIHILLDFLEELPMNRPFEFLGITDLGVLLNLIVTNQLYCFCLKYKRDILGYYFFKNANIQYEDLATRSSDCDTLHFIASYNNCRSVESFILGYIHSIKAILKLKKTFRMLLFDDIAHNGLILPSWKSVNPQLVETDCAYYLYNMVFPKTVQSNKCFIL